MDQQPSSRQRRSRYFEPRPVNRRTSGFWQILPPPSRDFDGRTSEDTAGLGPYETRYDVDHGYGTERTIINP